MRINNISLKISKKRIFTPIFISLAVLICYSLMFLASGSEVSIRGFGIFMSQSFQFLAEGSNIFIPIVLCILLPIGCVVSLIWSITRFLHDINSFNTKTNLKYVDFIPSGLNFCYNKKESNLFFPYEDIEKLTIEINTQLFISTQTQTPKVGILQIVLNFTTKDRKKLVIKNTGGLNPYKLIYGILDYKKKFNDFSYEIEGPSSDIPERIETYLKYNSTKVISAYQAYNMKLGSLFLFAFGIWLLFFTLNCKVAKSIILLPYIAIITSFIVDFYLIKSENLKKLYGGMNEPN